MALKYLIPLDLNNNEIRNVLAQLLGADPGAPLEGQFWFDSTNHVFKFRNNSATITLGRLDQISAPTADVSLASHKLTNVTDPGSPQDAATKNYVDGVATGSVYWKNPVRVLAATNINLATPGAAIDGITLTNGDRVGLAGQSTASQNGIYTFNGAASLMTRASDSDTSAEVRSGMAFWVSEGTANADTAWTLTTNDPITLDTTSLVFVQFSGLGQVTAGAGLTKTGNTLDIGAGSGITVNADNIQISATYAGQTSIITVGTIGTGTWQGTAVAIGFGGTGAATAAGARTNLGACGKYSALIGNGSSTAIIVTAATHGLGATNQLQTQAYEASTGAWVLCDITVAASGDVTFTFAVAPASNAIRIVIIG